MTEYTVSVTGNDANSGTELSPWRTVQRAVNSAAPGDIITIRAGSYAERVDLTGSTGTEGQSGNAVGGYITYRAYPGESVVMDGSGFSSWGGAFMSGKWAAGHRAISYIRIQDLICSGYPEFGVIFENSSETPAGATGSHHIMLVGLELTGNGNEGCYFEGGDIGSGGESHDIVVSGVHAHGNGGHGIKFSGDAPGTLDRLCIRDSSILRCIANGNGVDGAGDGIGIHVSTGCRGVTISGCQSFNNHRQGIAYHEVTGSSIENCESYGNGTRLDSDRDGIAIWSSTGITVKNSNIHENNGYGLYVTGDDGSISISGNTVIDNILGQIVLNGSEFIQAVQTRVTAGRHGWALGPWIF